jgi:putative heme-binding domain-containing protein
MINTLLIVIALLAPAQDSSLVRLLKGGKIPAERQGTVIDMFGRRGTAADLTYLLGRVVAPEGFESTLRRRALDALADAARNRGTRPDGDLAPIMSLAADPALDPDTRARAARLAGLWTLPGALEPLAALASADATPAAVRAAAVEALANLGEPARARLESLDSDGRPTVVRALAVAALARHDLAAAADRAAALLAASSDADDLTPLVAAFVNRQGGPEALAAALARRHLAADPARRALRALYALGRADAPLVAALSAAAGLDAEVAPLSDSEMAALVAEVQASGDAARGERVFRRTDLNCLGCHAVAGVGNAIGPDLGPIGTTSPPDYLLRSLFTPDEAIKEQFHTLVILTVDGQVFHGIVADRDDQRVILKEATGATRAIPISEIEEEKPGGSLMPKGLTNLMTRGELVDLVRYLGELGRPGPYALPPAPVVRRWRVFRDVPADLQRGWPETVQVYLQLLNADAARWTPAYALHSGDLPLADLASTAGGPVLYLLAEVDVADAGDLVARLDDPAGVRLWVGSRVAEIDAAGAARFAPATGRQQLVLRVDTALRERPTLRLTVEPAPGSTARATPVGGP